MLTSRFFFIKINTTEARAIVLHMNTYTVHAGSISITSCE